MDYTYSKKAQDTNISESEIEVVFHKCAGCKEYIISVIGKGTKVKGIAMRIKPQSVSRQFPEYVPESIREDYEEACLIATLSPKASATLLRRCLQGIIRDFYKVSKTRLVDEIDAIKNDVDSSIIPVLTAFREIGNIGAHPPKDINAIVDIEPDEVQKLIMGIEHILNETYIKKADTEKLLNDIVNINESKKVDA